MDAEGHAQVAAEPIPCTRQEYLDSEGTGVSSHVLRYLLYATTLGWRSAPDWKGSQRTDRNREVRVLARALIEELVEHLESTGLEFVFLLFHGSGFLHDRSPHRWRDEVVI